MMKDESLSGVAADKGLRLFRISPTQSRRIRTSGLAMPLAISAARLVTHKEKWAIQPPRVPGCQCRTAISANWASMCNRSGHGDTFLRYGRRCVRQRHAACSHSLKAGCGIHSPSIFNRPRPGSQGAQRTPAACFDLPRSNWPIMIRNWNFCRRWIGSERSLKQITLTKTDARSCLIIDTDKPRQRADPSYAQRRRSTCCAEWRYCNLRQRHG